MPTTFEYRKYLDTDPKMVNASGLIRAAYLIIPVLELLLHVLQLAFQPHSLVEGEPNLLVMVTVLMIVMVIGLMIAMVNMMAAMMATMVAMPMMVMTANLCSPIVRLRWLPKLVSASWFKSTATYQLPTQHTLYLDQAVLQ